jgi:hypothetical protein
VQARLWPIAIGPNQTPRQLKATNVFVNAPFPNDNQIYEHRRLIVQTPHFLN